MSIFSWQSIICLNWQKNAQKKLVNSYLKCWNLSQKFVNIWQSWSLVLQKPTISIQYCLLKKIDTWIVRFYWEVHYKLIKKCSMFNRSCNLCIKNLANEKRNSNPFLALKYILRILWKGFNLYMWYVIWKVFTWDENNTFIIFWKILKMRHRKDQKSSFFVFLHFSNSVLKRPIFIFY